MGRYKALIGPRLRARGFATHQTEAAIGIAVLNRMLAAGRPDSVRRLHVIAWRFGAGLVLRFVPDVHQRQPEHPLSPVPTSAMIAVHYR
jgi:hypothetical protein